MRSANYSGVLKIGSKPSATNLPSAAHCTLRLLNSRCNSAMMGLGVPAGTRTPSVLFLEYRLISVSQLICGQDHSNGAADQAIAGELRGCPGVAEKDTGIDKHGAGET